VIAWARGGGADARRGAFPSPESDVSALPEEISALPEESSALPEESFAFSEERFAFPDDIVARKNVIIAFYGTSVERLEDKSALPEDKFARRNVTIAFYGTSVERKFLIREPANGFAERADEPKSRARVVTESRGAGPEHRPRPSAVSIAVGGVLGPKIGNPDHGRMRPSGLAVCSDRKILPTDGG